ncbi:hypothetical protein ACFO5X_10220 [Seohaeicola nanhaiensis]|uniref:Uncharacterized protein n=1 Tax=Seohaeicola nanhaiensis TaxID=1387282 RepID=A0ABV9KFQ8_9RHOB
MSFFPSESYRRGDIIGGLDLCEIDTAGGPARFIIGADGVFTDVNGNTWVGSSLGSVSSLGSAIGGEAPEGSMTLSFFQDPRAPDLVAQVKALGLDYIRDRPVTFYIQPFATMEELYAPVCPPLRWLRRIARSLTFSANGAQDRSITLSFEAWSEKRRAARRIALNTEGHARLIGEPNPSLEHIPTTDFEEEKLFG